MHSRTYCQKRSTLTPSKPPPNTTRFWVEEVHDPAHRSPEELCSLSQHISGSPLTGSCPFDDWAQIASNRTSPAMLFVA